jgi:hypothetical protein
MQGIDIAANLNTVFITIYYKGTHHLKSINDLKL